MTDAELELIDYYVSKMSPYERAHFDESETAAMMQETGKAA